MSNKSKIIVFKEDLEFVGVFTSRTDTAFTLLKDVSKSNEIAKYLSGKINSLEGYIFLEYHEGAITAEAITFYKEKAKERIVKIAIYSMTPGQIADLTVEHAEIITDILIQYNKNTDPLDIEEDKPEEAVPEPIKKDYSVPDVEVTHTEPEDDFPADLHKDNDPLKDMM